MKISRNNYEAWFIDYSDGTLTAEQRAELLLFLEQHPDLKAEFENFVNEPIVAMNETLPDSFTSSLKRGDVNESNLSYYLIASMEGDLSAQEQNKLDAFLQKNPAAAKQQSLVALTRLQPVEEIYPAKAELKKPVPMVFSFTRTMKYAVAAMLLLTVVAGSYVIYTKTVSTNKEQYAGPSIRDRKADRFSVTTQGPELAIEQRSGASAEASAGASADGRQEASPGSVRGADVKPVRRNRLSNPVEQRPSSEQMAERRDPQQSVDTLNTTPQPQQPLPQENLAQQTPVEKETPATATLAAAPAGEEYVSVWEAIRGSAENKAREFAGQQEPVADTGNSRSRRPRLIDLIGKGVEKLTNEKVQYHSTRESDGSLASLQVSSGRFGIEHASGE